MITFEKAVEEALKASKYDYLTGRKERLLDKIINIIFKILEKIFKGLNFKYHPSQSSVNPDTLQNIFLVIFVLMIILVIGTVYYFYIKRTKRMKVTSEIFDEFRQNKFTYEDLLKLSREAEEQDNYRMAVRFHYLTLILTMTDKNIVTVTDSMTGGQFLREVNKNAPRFAKGVNDTINMFYFLWFGNKTVESTFYNNYKSSYHKLIEEVLNYE